MGRTLRRFQVAARLGFYTVPYHSKVLPTPQRKKGAFNSPVGACIPIYRGGISESRYIGPDREKTLDPISVSS